MIKFVWQHKYTLLFFIIICFGFSIFKLKDPTIFYDSERILQFADDIEIEKDENINSSKVLNIIESPIKGPKGNVEFLITVKFQK